MAGDTFISCYPNAGLPNPMSETGFDETPEITASLLEEFAKESGESTAEHKSTVQKLKDWLHG